MERRRIGSLSVSAVGLGTNNFGRRTDAAGAARVIDAALDAGVDFFDTADLYGDTQSEEILGRSLGDRRHRVVLASKFGWAFAGHAGGAHPDYVHGAIEESLRRLRTDHLDLYQLHKPDPAVPIAETLGALDELVRAGKVREIGCSNLDVEQLREAERAVAPGAARFVSVQNEYSLMTRTPECGVLAECARQGLAFLPFFPLASGLLTGKYRRGEPPPAGTRLATSAHAPELLTEAKLRAVETLTAFAEQRGRTVLELAIGWLLSRPVVASVIAGATTPEQVRANAAAGAWRLSAAEVAELDAALVGTPAAAPDC